MTHAPEEILRLASLASRARTLEISGDLATQTGTSIPTANALELAGALLAQAEDPTFPVEIRRTALERARALLMQEAEAGAEVPK